MQENTKQVAVKMTARRCFRTEPIYQYDVGHVLTFEGFELPAAFEVHFSRSSIGKAITQIGTNDVCTVPDMFAQNAGVVYAWLYIAEEDTGLTKFSIEMPVQPKAKPTDQQPTPVEQSAVDQAISALNAGVEAAENAQEAAEAAQASAESYAESAGQSAITATNAATSAAASAGNAAASATSAGTSATDANASREAADQSATNAGVSERAAASSASAAASSASGAAQSASSASRSASSASEAAGAAVAAKGAAETAQAAAESVVTTVTESAADAAESATIATGAATNAAASAASASSSATAAAGSATAAAGSAQTAQDVLDSIPADYSTLSGDINSLKSAFDTEISAIRDGLADEVTSYPTVTKTSGKYLKADGSIGDIGNSGYKVTNYIPVNGFTTAIITGSAGTNFLICAFYDANQTYIPDSGVAGADAKEENKQVAIPANASYIVVAADSRATAACTLVKWSYDFADKYEDGYVRAVTRWKTGNINASGQEIYNAHPAISEGYLSIADYDYIRRSDSYDEGWLYYYTYNEADTTYTYEGYAQVPVGVDYVLNKSYTHFKLRLFDGWSNTVDPAVASQTFGLYKYETFSTRPVWYGKKWAAIGDSLTEFNSTASIKYHTIISQQNGIAVINLGDGGTGYKSTDGSAGDSFMDRVAKVPLDADVITIFGSGNDLGSENEIGTPTDTGTTTLCGCINTTIDNLLTRMPLANLGIVTPTPWQQYNPANDQNKMALYAAAIVTICKNRGIPCLDLYHCSGLRPWDSTFKNLAYANADGVHPNNIGHALIAPKFQAFLDTLLLH